MPLPRRRISALDRAFPRRHVTFSGSVERRDLDLATQDERRKGQVQPHDDVVALARRRRSSCVDRQDDVEIAGGAAAGTRVALPVESQARAGLDARRDLRASSWRYSRDASLAAARLAGLLDDRAVTAAACRTGASLKGIPARTRWRPRPPQAGQRLRPRARLRAGAAAGLAAPPAARARCGASTPNAASRKEISIR